MTRSEAYDYLVRPRRLQRLIWRKTMQHDELESCLLPSAIRYDKDVVQTSPEDKMLEVAAKVLDLEREIRELQKERANLILEVNATISALPDETEASVLTAYFISRKPMVKIADQIGYSNSHCYYLYRKGLQHVAEQLNNNNKTEVIS